MESRDILIYLSIKNKGSWSGIFSMLSDKVKLTDDEISECDEIKQKYEKLGVKLITIIDDEYPTHLKHSYRPPFVLYCFGDETLLKETSVGLVGIADVDKMIDELNTSVTCIDTEGGLIEIMGKESNLIVAPSLDKDYVTTDEYKDYLTNLFTMLYNKVVLTRLDDSDTLNIDLLVNYTLMNDKDLYVQPTVEPSMNNTLIKNGAFLYDSISDLKD